MKENKQGLKEKLTSKTARTIAKGLIENKISQILAIDLIKMEISAQNNMRCRADTQLLWTDMGHQ